MASQAAKSTFGLFHDHHHLLGNPLAFFALVFVFQVERKNINKWLQWNSVSNKVSKILVRAPRMRKDKRFASHAVSLVKRFRFCPQLPRMMITLRLLLNERDRFETGQYVRELSYFLFLFLSLLHSFFGTFIHLWYSPWVVFQRTETAESIREPNVGEKKQTGEKKHSFWSFSLD